MRLSIRTSFQTNGAYSAQNQPCHICLPGEVHAETWKVLSRQPLFSLIEAKHDSHRLSLNNLTFFVEYNMSQADLTRTAAEKQHSLLPISHWYPSGKGDSFLTAMGLASDQPESCLFPYDEALVQQTPTEHFFWHFHVSQPGHAHCHNKTT